VDNGDQNLQQLTAYSVIGTCMMSYRSGYLLSTPEYVGNHRNHTNVHTH